MSDADLPKYRQIADDLSAAIRAGTYAEGRGLPSESELARTYDVSRGTVRQAFTHLRAAGVVSSRRGARRQVRPGHRLQGMAELLSFSRWARGIGEQAGSRTALIAIESADAAVAAALDLPADGQALHVVRVRLLGEEPVMLEDTWYPLRLEPVVRGVDLDAGSITEGLERAGVALARAVHRIEAVAATPEIAALLEVAEGTALLRATRRTTDQDDQPVEHSVDVYRGDAVAFVVRNSARASSTTRVSAPGPAPEPAPGPDLPPDPG